MKWKKFLGVVACAVLVASFGLVVTACGKKEATLPEIDEAQQSISMEVSATSDKMLIDITSNEEDVGNAETQVVDCQHMNILLATNILDFLKTSSTLQMQPWLENIPLAQMQLLSLTGWM